MHTQAQAQSRATEHEAENKMVQNAMCKMPSPMIHAPIKTCQEEGTHIASKPVIWKIDSFIQVQYSSLQHLTPCSKQSDTNKCEILCRAMRKCLAALPVVSVAQVGVAIGGGSTWKPSICEDFVRGTFRKLVRFQFSHFQVIGSNSCAGHEFLLWIPVDKVPKLSPFSD